LKNKNWRKKNKCKKSWKERRKRTGKEEVNETVEEEVDETLEKEEVVDEKSKWKKKWK
jgi:hypothetical protein